MRSGTAASRPGRSIVGLKPRWHGIPPTLVIFGTRADVLPEDYRRYLVNSFRDHFTMPGVPIRLQLRSPRNPYAEDEG